MRLARYLVVLLLVPVLFAARTTYAAPTARLVTSVEGITEYQLPNGLRVLLFPDASKKTFTVNITYLVGSRHESYGETGMAHLLEHMMFKGSPKHPALDKEMTSRGASNNASTWLDRTNYFETMPAGKENLEWALGMEADRMVNAYIAKKDLDSEMTVVRNEFEMGENNPSSILIERMLSTAYLWHNYGHSTIGARSDIENVPIERLQGFYRRFYQPDNAVLLIAGNFDPAAALDLLDTTVGRVAKPTRSLDRTWTREPVQDGERSVVLRRTGDVQLVATLYHMPSGADPDLAAISILNQVLGDSPSGRLYKNLVEAKKAASVFAFPFQTREPGVMAFGAEVRKGQSLDQARAALLATLEGPAIRKVTPAEVERARNQILKEVEMSLNKSEEIGLELSEWIAMGDWRLYFLNRDRVSKVTPADVERVAGRYLKASNRTLGEFIPTAKPDRATIPADPDIAAMLKDYKGKEQVAQGEVFDPTPANIEARTSRSTVGGIKAAVLAKKTRGGRVVAGLTLRFGDLKGLTGKGVVPGLVADMLSMGCTKRTRQAIRDELDRLKAHVDFSGGAGEVNVSIETVRANLPAVIRLVGELLRTPTFPVTELAQLKQETIATLEQQRSDPQALAGQALARHCSPYAKGDPRYVASVDERIAELRAVTPAALKAFHSGFYSADRGEFSASGDLDTGAVLGALKQAVGGWTGKARYARIANPYYALKPVAKTIPAPDKEGAVYLAAMNLQLRDNAPDAAALALANRIFGGNENSRLWNRLRQKDGLCYGTGASLSLDSLYDRSRFVVYAIVAPQNMAAVDRDVHEELARALKDGFTADEVRDAISGLLKEREAGRAADSFLAGRLGSYLYLGRTFQWDAEMDAQFRALTPDQVNAAFRKWINAEGLAIFRAGDFSKVK